MLCKIKKAALILALAALYAAGQAQTNSWARGHEEMNGSSAGYTNKANAEPQGMGKAHDAGRSAEECKQNTVDKDPINKKGADCDKVKEKL